MAKVLSIRQITPLMAWLLLALLTIASPTHTSARTPCPADGCNIVDGRYQVFLPDQATPRHVLMFFHGFGGSARNELDNLEFRRWAEQEKIILIFPDGIDHRWAVSTSSSGRRDETAFAKRVWADAQEQFGISELPLLISGFSLGGSMVWTLACSGQLSAAGYIAFSGAFWEPAPATCAPMNAPVIHVHGRNDTVVPMGGRTLRSGAQQAPWAKAMNAITTTHQCAHATTSQSIASPGFNLDCAALTDCEKPVTLTLCLHDEGHSIRLEWLTFALSRMRR